jgi:hypothetical protein
MRLGYHSAVQKDVNRILRRYDKVSGHLGDEFWSELQRYVKTAAANPSRFHPFIRDLCRANLKRFPYHFLYRILSDSHSRDRRAPPQAESAFRPSAQTGPGRDSRLKA